MWVLRLGVLDYEEASRFQEELAAARARRAIEDVLLLVQHPPVITVGRGGGWDDILASRQVLRGEGVQVLATDRGGKATYHGPGQLVAYPVFEVAPSDLFRFVWRLEEAAIRALKAYGLAAGRLEEHPGVWVDGQKIAAVGLAVRDGITRHGLALNVAPNLEHFGLLVPCGIPDRGVTSMERELDREVTVAEVTGHFERAFASVFGRHMVPVERAELSRLMRREPASETEPVAIQPTWLWRAISREAEEAADRIARLLATLDLHTVCQEARCPNIAECFGQHTATFMILGDTCTRACRFCAVRHGQPQPLDAGEPRRVATAAERLGLRHVVVTSVTRDDLLDGGAEQYAATIRAVHRRLPGGTVEVLVPDFGGSQAAMQTVLDAGPDVWNHNVETVPRLYPRVRPQANYERSLEVLSQCKSQAPHVITKSGFMLGLGERTAEVLGVLGDLRGVGCDVLTLGQYLQPTERQLPVARYVPPQEFGWYQEKAEAMGFRAVASGPLVRSSYHAQALWELGKAPSDGMRAAVVEPPSHLTARPQ